MKRGFFNKITGYSGEDAAAVYLKKNKYKILDRNHTNKCGEIDIIAQKGEDLVFVEVKTRRNDEFGTPAQAVTYYKRQNIINAAKWYISKNPTEFNIRFDVIEVYGIFDGTNFELEKINHIQQAFLEV